jgi:hypothetical protein
LAEQQALDCDSAEAEEHLTRHGMLPNHLFEEEALKTPTEKAMVEVLNLLGNSPQKKRPRMRQEHYGPATDTPQRVLLFPLPPMFMPTLLPSWKQQSA